MVPERHKAMAVVVEETDDVERPIDPEVRLMYSANEGDLDGIRELLDSDVNVNFKDNDSRSSSRRSLQWTHWCHFALAWLWLQTWSQWLLRCV